MDSQKPVKNLLGSRHNRKLLFSRKSEVVFIYAFLIAFIIVAATLSSHFLGMRNVRNLFSKNVGLLLVSLGQMFVILLGGVDLSTGAVISVINVLCVSILRDGNIGSYFAMFVVAIAFGALVGLINGFLVTKGNIQPIIATLATQTILSGIALYIQAKPGGELPKNLCNFLTKGWNYAVPIIIGIAATLVIWLLLNRTRTGRNILAVGGNEQAARSSGILVDRTKVQAFIICGIMSALAGLYISAYSKSGSPIIGDSYSQNSINAAVIGGASLMGGKSSAIGCVAAVLIIGIVGNILNLMHVSSYYQYVLTGVILRVALTMSALRKMKQ